MMSIKKIVSTIIIALMTLALPFSGLAQPAKRIIDVEQKTKSLEVENRKLNTKTNRIEAELNSKWLSAQKEIKVLHNETEKLRNDLNAKSDSIRTQIVRNQTESKTGDQSLSANLSRNTKFWIAAVAFAVLLSVLLYILLLTKGKKVRLKLKDDLKETKRSLSEQVLKADSKILELLDKQLDLEKSGRYSGGNAEEIDHSLVLKVADEITRIENNLNHMGSDTRGHKQLTASVTRMKNNLLSSEYEMVDLLNKNFNSGMSLIADFIPDENLEPDVQIITKVIQPQLNFRGNLIQAAKVIVSIGD